MSFYARDLAYVHDAGFGDFARDASPGLLRMLTRAGIQDGLVVDLGCGSGIWARALTDAGYDVLGIDGSGAMLELARSRAPAARFKRGSVFDAVLPPCAAVTAIGECFNYRHAAGPLGPLFRRVRSALQPGGLFVFDVAGPGRERRPRRSWYEGRDWTLCLEASEDSERGELTRRITVFRQIGERWRRSEELHRLALYDAPHVIDLLTRAGFEASALRGYDRGVRFRRGLLGFAATKR